MQADDAGVDKQVRQRLETREAQSQDVGNIVFWEHLNYDAPHAGARFVNPFFVQALGLTRDPDGGFGSTSWFNAGQTQFHVGLGQRAQVVDGHVMLVVPSLSELKRSLIKAKPLLRDSAFSVTEEKHEPHQLGEDEQDVADYLREEVDLASFLGSEPQPELLESAFMHEEVDVFEALRSMPVTSDGHSGVKETVLRITDPFGGTILARQGCPMDKVPFSFGLQLVCIHTSPGAAKGIGRYFQRYFQATVRFVLHGCIVSLGPGQSIHFKETDKAREYTGYHLCVYVACFSFVYRSLKAANLIHTDHAFDDKCSTLREALVGHQFRTERIVDPSADDDTVLHRLQLEVRSLHHPAFRTCRYNRRR